MALPHRRSRRSKRDIEATEPLLTFQLRQDWFALPLAVVEKVMLLDQPGSAISTESLHEQDIQLLDVSQCIFTASEPETSTPKAQGCLAILQDPQGQMLGLPLDSQPKLQRVPVSQLAPLSSDSLAACDLQGIIAIIELTEAPFRLLLLDPEQLQIEQLISSNTAQQSLSEFQPRTYHPSQSNETIPLW